MRKDTGLTGAFWQVLSKTLVEKGQAEYLPNPAHARAKLLQPTDAGRYAIAAVGPGHFDLADRLARELGLDGFQEILKTLRKFSGALEAAMADRAPAAPEVDDVEALRIEDVRASRRRPA